MHGTVDLVMDENTYLARDMVRRCSVCGAGRMAVESGALTSANAIDVAIAGSRPVPRMVARESGDAKRIQN